MTDEQIRLYALARIVAPTEARIRTIAERASGGTLYTVELDSGRKRNGVRWRWFAVHSSSLRALPDEQLVGELRRAFAGSVAPGRPA